MRRESGGNPNAVSGPNIGAFQCNRTAHKCPPLGNLAAQSRWADHYVHARYGTWKAALRHERAAGWY